MGDALSNLIVGWLKRTLIAEWLKFLFEMLFSGVVSFLFICGGGLVGGASDAGAIGMGMIFAALAMTVLFRREQSKLTKGMIVVLPEAEAGKELATDFQTIQKSEEKK